MARRRCRRSGHRLPATLAITGALVAAAHTHPGPTAAGHASPAAARAAMAVAYARARIGDPYVWGGTGPYGYDCSGLVMEAYRAAGVGVPRTSQEQWAAGPRVTRPQAGDLVFFAGSDGTMTAPGHVGIVTGPGEMIDAPYTGADVRAEPYAGASDLVGFTRPAGVR